MLSHFFVKRLVTVAQAVVLLLSLVIPQLAQAISWAPGISWAPATGPEGGTIYSFAIDPATPSTLYAGTPGGGVFTSTDSGATWAAANNGLTCQVVSSLAIDPANPANLYAGTDGGGVQKNVAPVIHLLGSNPMTISLGGMFTDPGTTVYDDIDAGLSAVVTGSVDTNTVGSYTLTYNAMDSDVHTATPVTRTVNVTDQTAPVITLLGSNPMTVNKGSTFTDPGATVSDNVDTGLAATVSGSVDTNTVGSYILTYNAMDAAGNAATTVTRTINVETAASSGGGGGSFGWMLLLMLILHFAMTRRRAAE